MSSYVDTRVVGGVAEIVLNRPRALNALDITMIRDLHRALAGWRDDDSVYSVLVRSAAPKAFCAGGDIRAIRDAVLQDDVDVVAGYFSEEYRLDHLVAEFPKPYVALIDGAAMGGGLGISVHGMVRVVTERALMAMPETAIGFITDVGASHFLPRLTGGIAVGMYLGLTGARVSAGDAIACGLATHFVPSDRLDELTHRILAGEGDDALARLATQAPESELVRRHEQIEAVFTADTVAEMLRRLDGTDEWSATTRANLESASPLSLLATAELIRRGASSTLSECLERELRVARGITQGPDFAEGVRAVLVDKDRNPSWKPAELGAVEPAAVAALFG